MDALERVEKRHSHVARHRAADDAREDGGWALIDRDIELADPHVVQALAAAGLERVAHEIANGREHGRDLIRILIAAGIRGEMLEHQAGFGVNQEDLLNAILQPC